MDVFEFFVVCPSRNGTPATFRVRACGVDERKPAAPDDPVYYGLYFDPPLAHPSEWDLYVTSRADDTLVFHTPLVPPTVTEVKRVQFLDRSYAVYASHALSQDDIDLETTRALYIQMEQSSVIINMGLYWMPAETDGRVVDGAPFFPPDVDPRASGFRIDSRIIPQRTPGWFKMRDEVTGTKAYKLMGFWVPTAAADPTWTYDGEERFTEVQKAAMRLGAQSEDYATLIYMSKFSERSVETVGWCKSPKPGWGASPDGIVLDPSMTWAHVDQSIAQYYTEDERNPLSIQKGVLEIKTSAKSLSMADYYYPQLYVEMFATRALWCDLVRYRQQRTWDERTRSWTFQHRARIYRVYRHRPTEEAMFRLIQYALSNRARLQQVVHEDSNFLEMRAHFRKLAAAAPYTEVDAPLGSPLYEQLERYRVEKEAAASAPAEAPPFPLEGCRQESEPCPKVDHTAWLSETGARQHQIARLAAGGNGASSDEVARLLVEQIQAHARVLEKLLM